MPTGGGLSICARTGGSVGTEQTDEVAHHLHEALGFCRLASGGHGAVMYVYERDL